MIDKVQKIREEVERLREQLQNKVEESDFISGEVFIINYFLTFIDSLQEESVSDETMTIRKEWFEHCKKSWYNEGYIDGKYNRKSQFEESVPEEVDEDESK